MSSDVAPVVRVWHLVCTLCLTHNINDRCSASKHDLESLATLDNSSVRHCRNFPIFSIDGVLNLFDSLVSALLARLSTFNLTFLNYSLFLLKTLHLISAVLHARMKSHVHFVLYLTRTNTLSGRYVNRDIIILIYSSMI